MMEGGGHPDFACGTCGERQILGLDFYPLLLQTGHVISINFSLRRQLRFLIFVGCPPTELDVDRRGPYHCIFVTIWNYH